MAVCVIALFLSAKRLRLDQLKLTLKFDAHRM